MKKKRYEEQIAFRISKEQRRKIEEITERRDLTHAEWFRELIDKAK